LSGMSIHVMKLRGTLNYPSFQPAPLIIDQNVVFIHPHTFLPTSTPFPVVCCKTSDHRHQTPIDPSITPSALHTDTDHDKPGTTKDLPQESKWSGSQHRKETFKGDRSKAVWQLLLVFPAALSLPVYLTILAPSFSAFGLHSRSKAYPINTSKSTHIRSPNRFWK
jgi:hypothetical protein